MHHGVPSTGGAMASEAQRVLVLQRSLRDTYLSNRRPGSGVSPTHEMEESSCDGVVLLRWKSAPKIEDCS